MSSGPCRYCGAKDDYFCKETVHGRLAAVEDENVKLRAQVDEVFKAGTKLAEVIARQRDFAVLQIEAMEKVVKAAREWRQTAAGLPMVHIRERVQVMEQKADALCDAIAAYEVATAVKLAPAEAPQIASGQVNLTGDVKVGQCPRCLGMFIAESGFAHVCNP